MNIEQTIRKLVEQLVEAWNLHDGASFSRLFAPDAYYVTGSGVRLAGRGQIEDALFAPSSDTGSDSDQVSLVTESIRILGPDAAVVLCAWRMPPADAAEGHESTVRAGFVTIVMQHTVDRLEIIALQTTDTTP